MTPNLLGDQSRRPGVTRHAALGIAALYVLFGIAYIITSDRIVSAIAPSRVESTLFQTIKGTGFILITGLLLWLLIARHVRQHERLHRSLEQSEARLRLLLDEAPAPICVLRAGRFEYLNAAGQRLLGPQSRLQGVPFLDRVALPSRQEVSGIISLIEAGGSRADLADQRLLDASGREIDVEIAVRPFAPDLGAVQLVIFDVTERKRLEAGLRHAQKMEVAGTLAAGISHEFNNLLTAILGYTTLARQSLPASASATRCLDQIDGVARHAAGIARSLLTLSRTSPTVKHLVPLKTFITEATDLARGVLPSNIKLHTENTLNGDVALLMDPAQLKQAILNLVLNARDAMPGAGILTIRTRVEAAPVNAEPGQPAGRAVIQISDTGPGIHPDALPRLYTPFFTTKPAGKGTGLGLPITKGVVEDHGGTISVESEPGRGTTFTISLPCAAAARPADPPIAHNRTAHVVIVGEDTPEVLDVVTLALRAAGYTVIPARDGPEVIGLVEQHRHRLDALVIDVGLPTFSGIECLIRARKLLPDLPVVLMTGGSIPDIPPEFDRLIDRLSKPFTTEGLVTRLGMLIDDTKRSAAIA